MRKGSGKITKLGDLFETYKKRLKAPQGIVVDCFRDVVFELVGLSIAKERIKYTVFTKTLSVQVSGPFKSEIQLRKKEIITHMKGRIGAENAPKEIL